jgi:acyl-CoA dehydrogenase
MSDTRELLVQAAQRVFSDHAAVVADDSDSGGYVALWSALTEAGMSTALHRDMAGELGLADAAALVRPAAYHGAAIPLAETLIAQWLSAGMVGEMPTTPMTFVSAPMEAHEVRGGWRIQGTGSRIPWLRAASHVVLPAWVRGKLSLAMVANETTILTRGHNLAGEPRDDLSLDAVTPNVWSAGAIEVSTIGALGAAFRSVQIAGAIDRVLELTVTYVRDRVQFGRPLSKLQAVQQLCATLAGHAAAATASADLALEALDGGVDLVKIAAAKTRTGEAAGAAAAIAHQLHGAMGVSREHVLHRFTRRLWAWRDEYGNEAHWSLWLGRQIARSGVGELWPLITESRKLTA